MKFHDFHLRGYQVEDFGRRIELDLVSDVTPLPRESSRIRFTDVAVHHFILTGGAIVTGIEGETPDNILKFPDHEFGKWAVQYGLAGYEGNTESYVDNLVKQGYRAWRIGSSVGMGGFIIAKGCVQVDD